LSIQQYFLGWIVNMWPVGKPSVCDSAASCASAAARARKANAVIGLLKPLKKLHALKPNSDNPPPRTDAANSTGTEEYSQLKAKVLINEASHESNKSNKNNKVKQSNMVWGLN